MWYGSTKPAIEFPHTQPRTSEMKNIQIIPRISSNGAHTDAKNIYPSPDTASPSPLFYAMCAVCKYVWGAFGYAGALCKTNNIILWRMQKCNRYTHTYHISSIESSACGVWYMFCVCAGRSGEDMMIEQVLLALWLSTNRSSARASILLRGATNDSTTRCGLAR